MNEDHSTLIQAEIDGINSVSDSAKVSRLVAEYPELQNMFNELKTARFAIESIPEKVPPASLKTSIMNSIPEPVENKVVSIKVLMSGLAALVKNPKPVTVAYAFSLGLIVAFIVSAVFILPTTRTGSGQIAGSMGVLTTNNFDTIAEHIIVDDEGGANWGSVKLHRSATQLVTEFTWDRDQPVEATLLFSGDFLVFAGAHVVGSPSNVKTATEEGQMIISGEGPLKVDVTLNFLEGSSGENELNIGVRSGDQSILRQSFDIENITD